MRDWELLTDWSALNSKATRMMRALVDRAPVGTTVTERYRGTRAGLMLYGPGSPVKLPIVKKHLARGGRVAMWDLGYWDRKESLRLSIDALHPTPEQIALSPAAGRRGFELREDADPQGPVLLIGLGQKSVYAYELGAMTMWERLKVRELRERFPRRRILWRPKGDRAVPLLDLQLRHGMPIEEALKGCSLLVCRHSNTAIDACIAGVPVECEDGAAAALYRGNPSPSRGQRADFLARLTWWNWNRTECDAAWEWVGKVTDAA